ncbi:hypothetical protein K0U27_00700 [archaeon]|nr:hypothetical protein [archaeon]
MNNLTQDEMTKLDAEVARLQALISSKKEKFDLEMKPLSQRLVRLTILRNGTAGDFKIDEEDLKRRTKFDQL